ncbi:MAG: MotA/TolQ/ExbB proton channel family protein [Burkholderiaceae bacterium]|nr:MotA/TolQ/ExbB proton channel family protein [Burkholderiaceae bacterium]MDP3132713.1 MotA/TolQ/ExbB proton channel family protein [Burkholderiaceae bacterium]MDZ4162173.1 MotA/TolQ/ExbB proton channel family protein [Burkholderiales bacterium]
MTVLWSHWVQADGVSRLVALVLLAMSVGSWVVIAFKAWLLVSADRSVLQSVPVFWQAPDWTDGMLRLRLTDRQRLVLPLVEAASAVRQPSLALPTLGGQAHTGQRLTRVLRDALVAAQHRLQFGQVWLATVGATAPFVGLLGTVWGIYHALMAMAAEGQITLDKVAGPVGEALVMTAAGLAVAIPAVLAYNALGRRAARTEAALDAFAHDLREWVLQAEAASA